MIEPAESPVVWNTGTPDKSEARELTRIIQGLERAFPNVKSRAVRHAVQQAHQAFAGSPIRDFVSLLVERAARDALVRQGGQLPTQTYPSPILGGTESAADSPLDASSQ